MKQIFIATFLLATFVFSGVQSAIGQTDVKLESEIGKLLRDFYDALTRRDQAAIDIFADNGFFYDAENGYAASAEVKKEFGSYLKSTAAASKKTSFEIEDLKVLPANADTVICNYGVISKSEQNGKIDVRRERYTDVFVRRDGRWQIVAEHSSLLLKPDSEEFINATKAVPKLAFDLTEFKVNPPVSFEGISAVTADGKGNIYVLHRPANGDPIVVIDSKGNFLRSWGKGLFTIPHGIRIDQKGNVWTVDAHTSVIYKFTPEGKKLLEIKVGGIPSPNDDFCGATDLAFAKNGHIFVADGYCNARVIEYDAKGKKLGEWGKAGSGPGEFNIVHSIAISPQGYIYVADRENGRIQWFDQKGKFLGQQTYGGQLFSVAFSQSGELYVSTMIKDDTQNYLVSIIKIDPVSGKMLGRIEEYSHELSITPDGAILPGTRSSELLLLRLRK